MADKISANKAKNEGNLNFKKGNFEEALKNYNEAMRLNPQEVKLV